MIREGCVVCCDCDRFLGYISELGIHRANALKRCEHCAKIHTQEQKKLWARKKRKEARALADIRLTMLSESYEAIAVQKAYIAKLEARLDKQDECIQTLEQKISAEKKKSDAPKKSSGSWLKFGKNK
ncbi:MAG: hypothetical protein IJY74_04930 [Oscillospiraceae bacterium]|nr:hypothetical protein [Oscillospiraceae bacterium]